MKKILFIPLVLISYSLFSQSASEIKIFNDTSLFFVASGEGLQTSELIEIDKHLIKAIDEFNLSQQRYADSVNPQKKKNKFFAYKIDSDKYFFELIPKINKEGQKEIWLVGNCKDIFKAGKSKMKYDPSWKKRFVDPFMIEDGGSCFIHVVINLTLKTHSNLIPNGDG